MEEYKIKVYAKINEKNIIIDVGSDLFNQDFTNWPQIDEGIGNKYEYAQGNYLEKGLMNPQSQYNYKLIDGKAIELTEEEKATLFPIPVPQPTSEEILRAKLIKDNASMQLQLSAQQKLNADILLKIAKLGGTTNV